MVRIVFVPLRLIAKAGFWLGRRLGLTRIALLGAGVVTGLLAAREPGHELRRRYAQKVRQLRQRRSGGLNDESLSARVQHELSQAPRTWHLPQPAIEISGRRVILSGSTPHAAGKADIEQVVAAVEGVEGVDNRLVVTKR